MGSAYGVWTWLLVATLLFSCLLWFNFAPGFIDPLPGESWAGQDTFDPCFNSFLLGGMVFCVAMAGIWRRG